MTICINPFKEERIGTPINVLAYINAKNQQSFDEDDLIGASSVPNLTRYDEVEFIAKGISRQGGNDYDIMRIRKNEEILGKYTIVIGHWNDGYVE